MKLISFRDNRYHVSLDAVDEFEAAIKASGAVEVEHAVPSFAARTAYFQSRLTGTLGMRTVAAADRSGEGEDAYFAVLMGEHLLRKCAPFFRRAGDKGFYLFDAWPESHDLVAKFCNSFGVANAFISSSQSAEMLQRLGGKTRYAWVPEGLDPSLYRSRPHEQRDIDVLSMGRKHVVYHQTIAEPLAEAGKNYLYEKVPGQLIFPARNDFLDGLARSRISICIPSSVTHPERARGVCTMTARYLQSMASRCLIVGHAPPEMVELFGYNPVVEIDLPHAAEQLLWLLDHYEDHLGLIERNHAELLARHTWRHRWAQLSELMQAAQA